MTKNTFRIAVLAILVNKEGKVLIGSSPRDGGYKFPQGGLNPNELPLDGLKREMQEELGLKIYNKDIALMCDEKVRYTYPEDDPYYIFKGQELTVFKIKYDSNAKLEPQDDEFDELHWIKPENLVQYDVQFRLQAYIQALELCNLL